MTADTREFFNALLRYIDARGHAENCSEGVVQSGPAEGNKIPCDCGYNDLCSTIHKQVNK